MLWLLDTLQNAHNGPEARAKERKEVKGGGEIRMGSDQWTVPTYTLDLANSIRALLLRNIPHGTYHLVNEGSVTWFDFAREIFRITGLSPKIKKITTGESSTMIKRPKRSILKNQKLKKLSKYEAKKIIYKKYTIL